MIINNYYVVEVQGIIAMEKKHAVKTEATTFRTGINPISTMNNINEILATQ